MKTTTHIPALNSKIFAPAPADQLVVIHTCKHDLSAIRFTWSADMQDCEVIAWGSTDEEIDEMINMRCHEGIAHPAFNIEVL